jgi:hypothetical protein
VKVAFTGTRQGMTQYQRDELWRVLFPIIEPIQFHHGGAIGADTQAHYMAREIGVREFHVWLPARKEWTDEKLTTVHHTRMPPLARNHLIIGHADLVIACPHQAHEIRRSGTWATIRYTRKAIANSPVADVRTRLIIIKPNGEEPT